MTRSPLRALAAALLATAVTGTLLASALTSSADAASSRPQVGDCHSVTLAEADADSDTDPRISCERSHTTRTVAVKDVSAADLRNDQTKFRAGIRVCSGALDRAIGGSARDRDLSSYDGVFFFPTKAQIRAGARWVRCDLALYGGTRLLPLPTDRSPAIGSAPHANGVAKCAQVTDSAYRQTVCSTRHNYRAVGTVKVAGSAYPGRDRLFQVARQRCPAIAGSDWFATWPGEYGWTLAKQRNVVCFSRNSR